jgi:hypothetical protein
MSMLPTRARVLTVSFIIASSLIAEDRPNLGTSLKCAGDGCWQMRQDAAKLAQDAAHQIATLEAARDKWQALKESTEKQLAGVKDKYDAARKASDIDARISEMNKQAGLLQKAHHQGIPQALSDVFSDGIPSETALNVIKMEAALEKE